MKIKWLGQACFQIKTNNKTIITDPYFPIGSMILPSNLTADIITVSHHHSDHNNIQAVNGQPKIIDQPGLNQINNILIKGISTFHDNVAGQKRGDNIVFVIKSEDLTLCHLGDLGHILSDQQLSDIGPIDILMIPVGGYFTIETSQVLSVINQLKPKIILPMHYKINDIPLPIQSVDEFLKNSGLKFEDQTELNITPPQLESNSKIIVLKKQ